MAATELVDPEDYAKRTAREIVARWMLTNGFATGHGDSLYDLLRELEWQVNELKSSLQAEAPEDAPKVPAQPMTPDQIDALYQNAAANLRAQDAATCPRSYEIASAYYSALAELRPTIDALRARTSQAEAQAPTTAASVLTDIGATVKVGSDGRWLCLQGIGQHAMLNLESLEVDSVHGPIVRKAINGFLKNLADRLTVGAPAPAPTMPTREQIAREVMLAVQLRSFGHDEIEDGERCFVMTMGQEDELKAACNEAADRVLALIAKGDTP